VNIRVLLHKFVLIVSIHEFEVLLSETVDTCLHVLLHVFNLVGRLDELCQ